MTSEPDLAALLASGDRPEFCSGWWAERLEAIKRDIATHGLTADFLSRPAFAACGLVTNDVDAAAAQHAEMDAAGYRVNTGGGHPTEGPTPITHAYHLWRAGWPHQFDATAGALMEWGGGYGSMARLTRRNDRTANGTTHVIVDTPVMCAVQQAYLARHGTFAVPWHRHYPFMTGHLTGGVWLAASGDAHSVAEAVGGVQTFIATFSLDECASPAHDYVVGHDWFGARRVLVAAQRVGKEGMFPDGASLYRRLIDAGFAESPTHYAGSVYLMWERDPEEGR